MKERVMNLAEQLRDEAARYLPNAPSVPTLIQAADTIEADATIIKALTATNASQSRLLALAETLAKDAHELTQRLPGSALALGWMKETLDSVEAFTTALTEYQTTGTVPCGKCEATKGALEEWRADFREVEKAWKGAEAERDEARRQFEGWDEERLRLVTEKAEALNEAKGLRRRLAEAQDANRLEDYRSAALRSERDQAHEIANDTHGRLAEVFRLYEQAQADNAAQVEALNGYRKLVCGSGHGPCEAPDGTCCRNCGVAFGIMARHNAGAPLLEEVEALRKLHEAVWDHYHGICDEGRVIEASKACDAIRNKENRHE